MNFSDVGRLAGDPEIRYFDSGCSKTDFTLAIDSAERDESGKPKTVWLRCEAWANAEGKGVGQTIVNYCKKGHQVYVQGQLKQDEWIDKSTDKKRTEIKLSVSQVKLLNNQKKSEESPKTESSDDTDDWADDPKPPKAEKTAKESKPNAYASTASKGKAMAYAGGDEVDDIPF